MARPTQPHLTLYAAILCDMLNRLVCNEEVGGSIRSSSLNPYMTKDCGNELFRFRSFPPW